MLVKLSPGSTFQTQTTSCLKGELRSRLQNSRASQLTGDHTEVVAALIAGGYAKIGMIQQVECIHPQQKGLAFAYREAAPERGVKLQESRPAQHVAAGVAKVIRSVGGKG